MPDLVLLVPSRGRPANVTRLIEACSRTCRADTVIAFGFDDDDPELVDNLKAADGCFTSVRRRMGLSRWTNTLAALHMDAPALCSLGDDMIPVTDGWDEQLLKACGPAGMAYPEDNRRNDIPEVIIMTTNIVRALGWCCLPELEHWYVDNVWSDLGRAAGCLSFLPDVIVDHRHPNMPGGDKPDRTYWDASPKMAADMAAYQRWRLKGMRADIEKVRAVCRQG